MSSTEPTAPSAPASAPGERTLLVAQPKLQRVDRLMVSDSDQTFISERSTQAYIRGGIVGAVSALATGALLWRRMAPSAAVALGATSGALMGLFGMASTLPQAIREGILFLPNSSPLKMSLFHVVQQMNPELSPRQIYTMIHRHERVRGRPLPPVEADDHLASGVPVPVKAV